MHIVPTWSKKVVFGALLLGLIVATATAQTAQPRWWKGNLHTHSFWSDGDDFPEMVVQWYQDHGYHFLALSDHNVLSQGRRWMVLADNRRAAFDKYVARFGDGWVETRENDKGQTEVRLKPLTEYRCRFERPGQFLLIQSEEITEKAHLNGINLLEPIRPQGGQTMPELLQNDIDAVCAQEKATGQAMLVHVNHPNFQWALTAEDMIGLTNFRFFEVYNAHGYVNNEGNEQRASTERMWDILLATRLAKSRADIVYAVATDDAHNYHQFDARAANPGQAWVVVRSAQLTPESIVRAMDAGDFYCSTGVTLKDTTFEHETLSVAVEPEPGVRYMTQFIGTRRGYDPQSEPVTDDEGKEIRTTRRYSTDIGEVLAEVEGAVARYTLKGDEIYIRAKVISSRKNEKSHVPDEREAAWTQPVVTP